MDEAQARYILNAAEFDSISEIKRKYRQLMGRFHPDVLGSEKPEHIRRAQEINEAYRILKAGNYFSEPASRASGWKWNGEWNESAFCPRNIYLYYSMETDSDKLYYKAARGKYMWDPDEEEFHLFLKSLYHASKELLEEAEGRRVSVRRQEDGRDAEKFRFQARLVHCLLQQFTDPMKILGKIAEPESYDKQDRPVYHFRALLEIPDASDGMPGAMVRKGETLYPRGFQENKILVRSQHGEASGYISFRDDCLYLCVIPLLKSRLAQVKMTVGRVSTGGERGRTRRKTEVDFYFRLEKTADQYRSPDQNLRIAEILRKYEKHCSG